MSRLIVDGTAGVYFPYRFSLEADFERLLVRLLPRVFDGYYVRSWKPLIRDWMGRGARPDLVLVSKQFDEWAVIEVELASHSTTTHVEPQLESLSMGVYDASLVPSLVEAVPEVGVDGWRRLLYRQPGLLCIADDESADLVEVCRAHNFELAVMQPYKGRLGGWGLHIKRVPSFLDSSVDVGVYVLRFGYGLGSSVFMEVPKHFPAYAGVVQVRDGSGGIVDCRVISGERRHIIMPARILPKGSAVKLILEDRDRLLFSLEVDR